MSELLELVKSYNLADIIIILILGYLAYSSIRKQIIQNKKDKAEELDAYYNKKNKARDRDETINHRLDKLEKHVGEDYSRIQKSESHLYQLEDEMKQLNTKLDDLSGILVNLRLESMRGRILDFAPLAIDLTRPQSKERYLEIYKVHSDYTKLVEQTGSENNFEVFNFELIEKSFETRSIQKLFTEDYYISQGDDHEKENN